jgi:hypothetical protein
VVTLKNHQSIVEFQTAVAFPLTHAHLGNRAMFDQRLVQGGCIEFDHRLYCRAFFIADLPTLSLGGLTLNPDAFARP